MPYTFDNDPYITGASVMYRKPREEVTPGERQMFKEAYFAAVEQGLLNKVKPDKLQTLEDHSKAVHMKMLRMLQRLFPEGTLVEVILNRKQKIPSEAEVVYWSASRYAVRVRLMKEKKYGGRHVCDVHWSKVAVWPQSTDDV